MIKNLFIENLLRMSITGAVVILAALLLRLCMRRLPKNFSYALWGIVLFRLLCPLSAELPVSAFHLLAAQDAARNVSLDSQLPPRSNSKNQKAVFFEQEEAFDGLEILPKGQAGGVVVSEMPKGRTVGGWQGICTVFWFLGMSAMLAYAAFDVMRLRKRTRSASLDQDNIYLLESISSPFVAGIVWPRIYLPYGLSEREREYVLLHEKMHIRRGDPLFRVLAYFALALHWFNPLVWAAFFVSERDMEMSCDEMVLRRLGMGIKREYASSLLAMAQGGGLVTKISFAFGEGDTGRRIKNVLNYKKTTVQAVLAGAFVIAITAVAFGTDPVAADIDSAASKADSIVSGADLVTSEADPSAIGTEPVGAEGDPAATGIDPAAAEADGEAKEIKGTVEGVLSDKPTAITVTIPVRSIARSARCIDRYVAPDEEWEERYGEGLAFAEDCSFFVNEVRDAMNAYEVSFTKFAKAIEQGDAELNKPCMVEIGDDGLVHSITLISAYYQKGVSYAALPYDKGLPDIPKRLERVRTETMDIASVPGEETVEIYTGYSDADGCAHGVASFWDKEGNGLHTFHVIDEGMCLSNLYAGRLDGAGDPFLLEVHLENRDTSGAYSYYVYMLGDENGAYIQTGGSSIEWQKEGPLTYDANEMAIFFHMLGHYLTNSHLLVGMEWKEDGTLGIRTDAVCDEDALTYANFAPACFPDPYEGMDMR